MATLFYYLLTREQIWYARELQTVLEYKQWRRFKTAIDKAIEACETSGNMVSDHFAYQEE